MGRRGENIRKRKDGRWEARAVSGPPVDGRTSYRYFYARSYKEARAMKKEFLRDLDTKPRAVQVPQAALPAPQVPADMPVGMAETDDKKNLLANTEGSGENQEPNGSSPVIPEPQGSSPCQPEAPVLFRTAADEWLAAKKLSIKEPSFAEYTLMTEKHLLPELGDIPVEEVDTRRIDALLLDKKNHGCFRDNGPLSDKTVSEIKGVLNRILRHSKARGYISVVPESMPVSVRQTPVSVFTEQEQEAIVAAALKEGTPFALSVLLCLYTGIREGEMCALRWSDFDWEEGTVSINKTVYRITDTNADAESARTHVVVATPKSFSSIRTVPLPSEITDFFRERAGGDSDYVATGTEKFMEPRVCRDRFKSFLKRVGVKYRKYHCLRHTYATRCVEKGVDIKTLSENLGHSDVSITLQLYVHPSMELKKQQVNKLPTFIIGCKAHSQAENQDAPVQEAALEECACQDAVLEDSACRGAALEECACQDTAQCNLLYN